MYSLALRDEIRTWVLIQGKSYIKVQNLALRNSSVNCVNVSDNTSGTGSTYIEISGLSIQNCNKIGIRARIEPSWHGAPGRKAMAEPDYAGGMSVIQTVH